MATVQQLIDEAHRVITESQEGGNTQSRIGNLYLGIIDFIDILDKRTIDGYEYDDTELKNAIRRVDEAIETLDRSIDDALVIVNQERDRLDNLVNELDRDIENKVNRMLDDASTLEDHASTIRELVNEGEIYWKSEWDANIEAYLQEVGVWARNGDVIKTQWTEIKQDVSSIQSTVAEVQTDLSGRPTSTQWSQITQKVNSIEQSVNSLVYDGDVTEALQSSINQSIEDGIAKLSLETTYAQTKDMGDAEEVIRWMHSALRNSASSEQTYAEIVAAGKDGLNNAIADMRTCVTTITNGDYLQYVSEASMETKVNECITGLYSKATSEESLTNIFSQVKKGKEDISEITVHCTGDYSDASIATKFENFRAGLVVHSDLEGAKAEITAAYTDEITKSAANLVLKSTMNEALAQMSADYNDKFAGVVAKADLDTAFVEMVAATTDTTNGPIASIVAAINGGKSSIKMTATEIEMTDAFANSLVANAAFVGYLTGGNASFSGNITAKTLTLGNTVKIPQANIKDLADSFKNVNDDIKAVDDKFTGVDTRFSGIDGRIDGVDSRIDEVDSDIEGITTTLGGFSSDLSTLNGALATKLSSSDVQVSEQTTKDGLTKRTITIGTGNEFTEIEGGDFLLHNIGRGTSSDTSKDYFMVSTEGVLRAHNAIIYGTIYANGGEIAGWEIAENILKHSSGNVGMYSGDSSTSDNNYSPVRFWAGGNRDSAPFRVTHAGSIYSNKGALSGWTMTEYELKSPNEKVGLYSGSSGSDPVRFWAGNSSRDSASYRVSESGKLYASNAEIVGKFQTGTTGNYITIDTSNGDGRISLLNFAELYGSSTYGGWLNFTHGSYTGTYRADYMQLVGSGGEITAGCNVSTSIIQVGSIYASSRAAVAQGYISATKNNKTTTVDGENGVVGPSDIRLKDIVGDSILSVEDIAEAPSFKFKWKDGDDSIHVGTSAQYWQDVLPEAVQESNGYLAINASTIATISSINTAREVVALKKRIAELEAKLSA